MNTHDSGTNSMDVERLAAVPIQPKAKVLQMVQPPLPTSPQEAPEPPVIIQRQEVSDVLLAAFAALGFAVSARALLFLSLVGAFALAVMAMSRLNAEAMIILGLYCGMTLLPLVCLEIYAKRGDK
jgi:hypothetical protein